MNVFVYKNLLWDLMWCPPYTVGDAHLMDFLTVTTTAGTLIVKRLVVFGFFASVTDAVYVNAIVGEKSKHR